MRSTRGRAGSARTARCRRDQAQGHRDLPRRAGSRVPGLWAAREPGGEGREAAACGAGCDGCPQPGGGPRARARGGVRAGRRVTASYTNGALSTPKSGKVRSVPMAPEVGEALARLGQRERFAAADDLVFVGQVGVHLDPSALLRRYRAALRAPGCGRCASTICATVRHASDQGSRHSARAGVDGPRRRPDHDALSPLRAAARRRRDHRSRVRNRPHDGPDVKSVPLTRATRRRHFGRVNPPGGSLRSPLLCMDAAEDWRSAGVGCTLDRGSSQSAAGGCRAPSTSDATRRICVRTG
jgi:hypothetical protein